jgi:hypothetical protein
MNALTLNLEYARRHLGVCVLMLGLGGWFGYDGLVTYPKTPAAQLYESIEKAPPPEGFDVEAFKVQKTQTQYGLMGFCLLVGAVVGLRLLASSKFRFEWDESGFVWKGVKHPLSDVKKVVRDQWEKKGILVLHLDREKVVLDAWHHLGVKDFEKMI